MGACPGLDFISPKMALHHNYLHWQISHSLYVYIHSVTTASGSRLFGSMVRALDFYPGSNPTIGRNFFQLCFIPLLRLSCRKRGSESDYSNNIYNFPNIMI